MPTTFADSEEGLKILETIEDFCQVENDRKQLDLLEEKGAISMNFYSNLVVSRKAKMDEL